VQSYELRNSVRTVAFSDRWLGDFFRFVALVRISPAAGENEDRGDKNSRVHGR